MWKLVALLLLSLCLLNCDEVKIDCWNSCNGCNNACLITTMNDEVKAYCMDYIAGFPLTCPEGYPMNFTVSKCSSSPCWYGQSGGCMNFTFKNQHLKYYASEPWDTCSQMGVRGKMCGSCIGANYCYNNKCAIYVTDNLVNSYCDNFNCSDNIQYEYEFHPYETECRYSGWYAQRYCASQPATMMAETSIGWIPVDIYSHISSYGTEHSLNWNHHVLMSCLLMFLLMAMLL